MPRSRQDGTRPPRRSIRMSSGLTAEIIEDPLQPEGRVLLLGGAEQSHVYPGQPERIFYEYLQRAAHVVDAVFPGSAPVRALHLGAGALTLPRYLEARRPGSRQTVVEIERELVDFVLTSLPLPAEADIECVTADARDFVEGLPAGSAFDVVFLDIFTGPDSPAHLADPAFYSLLAGRCAPGGTVVVNLGDDAGMAFARRQVRSLQSVFADVLVTAEARLFSGRYSGNVIAAGSHTPFDASTASAVDAAGPHPATTLCGSDADAFGEP
ncbi:spermidine synthase [Zafaria sp. Z1313]|uniref:spermidine synthase n=1 Tax=unclassified Zafaria TaxID=2828765 RepID=UPI002E767183|nr:fused MFS/spermidine synthase [Zafaria sp. J156]MEE1620735.1 fused MFS/spermidine synthase [Zafaria sp. J156]